MMETMMEMVMMEMMMVVMLLFSAGGRDHGMRPEEVWLLREL